MIICSYGCGKEAKYFFKTGNGCCEKSPNSCEGKKNKDSEKKKGKFKGTPYWSLPENQRTLPIIPWNKGKIGVYTEEHRKKISDSLKGIATGKASTPIKEAERKEKISETMKKNPLSGGLRKGSGKGKKGKYKGYWCDSSWELAFVIYNIDNNIKFERNKIGYEYLYKGKKHKYYPDYIISNVLHEIKGYETDKDKEKYKGVKDISLKILYKKDIQHMINYVTSKYGNDYIKLYEKDLVD